MIITRTAVLFFLITLVAAEKGAAGGLAPVSAALKPYELPAAGNDFSSAPILTPDGRFVVFLSRASDLITGHAPSVSGGTWLDVYIRDRTNQRTTLVSASEDQISAANGESIIGDVSADGRYVLFASDASNLVANDTNRSSDIFLRDIVSSTTILVSAAFDGSGAGNGWSRNPSLTPDGRYALFMSSGSNLVEGNTPAGFNLFMRDLQEKRTILVNVPLAPSPYGQYNTDRPAMSANGQRVAFWSSDANYVAGFISLEDRIYVRDLPSGKTYVASRDVAALWNVPARAHYCSPPAISADGRFVTFTAASFAHDSAIIRYDVEKEVSDIVTTNLVADLDSAPSTSEDGRFVVYEAGDSALTTALYRWDAETRIPVLVSPKWAATEPAAGHSTKPLISADGRFVSFVSSSSDLVTNQLDGVWQGYVRDMDSGTTRLSGVGPEAHSEDQSIPEPAWLSDDGRFAAFSTASGVDTADPNDSEQVYVIDLQTGTTELISSSVPEGLAVTGAGSSMLSAGALSADGRYVAFESMADNLVSGDTNRVQDIFVRDLELGINLLVSASTNGGSANKPSFRPVLSADGRSVAFLSRATDLADGDANSLPDLYVRDLATGKVILVSTNNDGSAVGVNASRAPFLSANGRVVLFASAARFLVPEDSDSAVDLFWRDLETGETMRVNDFALGAWFSSSADGRYVAYSVSYGPRSSRNTVVVWDAATGADIFIGPPGAAGQHLSKDGQVLYYGVTAGSDQELHAANLETGADELIGFLPQFTPWGSVTSSDDGRWVAYASSRKVAMPADSSGLSDVVLLDRFSQERTVVSLNQNGQPANQSSSMPSLSIDGRFLAFRSRASDLVAEDENGASDVFLYDRLERRTTMISRNGKGGAGSASSSLPLVSANGASVVFESVASDLVAGDYNMGSDVFSFTTRTNVACEIQSINRSGESSVSIIWSTNPGWRYRVEFKDDLSAIAWTTAPGTPVLTNQIATFAHNSLTASRQRFYRIVAEQP